MLDGTPYRDRRARLGSPATRTCTEGRLMVEPGNIPTKDLAAVSGIAADKVAKFEG